MTLETIERYLTEVQRQLKLPRPTYSSTNREIGIDSIVRTKLERLRGKLRAQRLYRQGYEDRIKGIGAVCTHGVYLDGYYSDGGLYYLTHSELDALQFGRTRLWN